MIDIFFTIASKLYIANDTYKYLDLSSFFRIVLTINLLTVLSRSSYYLKLREIASSDD